MKRRFSIVEECRNEYEIRTTDEQDENIDKVGFQNWLENVPLHKLFEASDYHSVMDYLNSDQRTICEE